MPALFFTRRSTVAILAAIAAVLWAALGMRPIVGAQERPSVIGIRLIH